MKVVLALAIVALALAGACTELGDKSPFPHSDAIRIDAAAGGGGDGAGPDGGLDAEASDAD